MKLAYIFMQFPLPSAPFASNDINALMDLGLDVHVYCLREKYASSDELYNQRHERNKVPVLHMHLWSLLTAICYMLLHPWKSFDLVRWIVSSNKSNAQHMVKSFLLMPSAFSVFNALKKDQPDLVHLFWGHYPSMVLYLLHRYLPHIPFTMFLGAYDLEMGYNGSVEMSKYTQRIFTHSHDNIASLVNMGIDKDKIEVYFRGVIVDDMTLQKVQSKTINDQNAVFLTASRLIEEKGVQEVIDIFANIRQKYPESSLYIAGDGPYKEMIVKQIHDLGLDKNIKLLGHIDQKKLFEYMEKADYFLLMSRYKAERLPNVIKEAMLRKCCCITTPTPGIDELIQNNVNGLVIDSKDEVIRVLSDKNLVQEKIQSMIEEAQKTIVEHFNVKNTMQKYLDIWKQHI